MFENLQDFWIENYDLWLEEQKDYLNNNNDNGR